MHKTLAELVEAFVLCIGDAGNYLHFDKLSDRNFSFVQLLHNLGFFFLVTPKVTSKEFEFNFPIAYQ